MLHRENIDEEDEESVRMADTLSGLTPKEIAFLTVVTATDDFALLSPNPILDEYASLYDRELTRSTGRNRNGV